MNLFLLAGLTILLFLTSACLLAVLGQRGRLGYLLGLYTLTYAQIVLVLELAGLVAHLNRATVAGLHVALSVAAFVAWWRAGRPPLFGSFPASWFRQALRRDSLRRLAKQPLLIVLALTVGLVYLRNGQINLVTQPDDTDSLFYHLSRVGYWLQYGSLYPWPAPNLRQTTFPMNGELGLLWTVLWWGTDQLAPFVQWSTVPAAVVGVAGLARLLGYSRTEAAHAALLWPTLTQVLLQSTTTQNDLVQTVFWVAAVYFLLDWLRDGQRPSLWLGGVAFGLAVGVKGVSLFVMPPLLLGLTAGLWLHRRQQRFRARVGAWALSALTGFLLLGAYAYAQNVVAFKHPLGPAEIYELHTGADASGGRATRLELLRDNVGRYLYQAVDFSPLPFGLAQKLNPAKEALFAPVYGVLGIDLNNRRTIQRDDEGLSFDSINRLAEFRAWFGPLAIPIIPLVLWHGWRGLRRQDFARLLLAGIAVGFLVLQSAAQNWTEGKGRFYLVPLSVVFPFIASVLAPRTLAGRAGRAFMVCLGIAAMLPVSVHLAAEQHMLGNRMLAITRQEPSWADEFTYRFVIENVPDSASIGLVNSGEFRDYPLFGEHFTRRVTLEVPSDENVVPAGEVERYLEDLRRSDYVLSARGLLTSVTGLEASGFDLLVTNGPKSLWIQRNLRDQDGCDAKSWPFTKLIRSTHAHVCPRFPLTLGIDHRDQSSRFRAQIGAGQTRGVSFDLLALQSTRLELSLDVNPGADASNQTLQLRLTGDDGQVVSGDRSFSGRRQLNFQFDLTPQAYTLELYLAEGSGDATIDKIELTAPQG